MICAETENWQLQYSTHELDRNCDLGVGVSELGTWLVGEGRTQIDDRSVENYDQVTAVRAWQLNDRFRLHVNRSERPPLGGPAAAVADVTAGVELHRPGMERRISRVSTRHDVGEDRDEPRVTPRRSTRQQTPHSSRVAPTCHRRFIRVRVGELQR